MYVRFEPNSFFGSHSCFPCLLCSQPAKATVQTCVCLLKPRIGPRLASELLIRVTWAESFANPVRQGKTNDDALPGMFPPVVGGDGDVDVEAPMEPVIAFSDTMSSPGRDGERPLRE